MQLYHACDQDVFSFCLMKYTVLQFCDFYTATMAYWVTVLAMGGLPEQAKSLLHMVGAIGVAMAIEYDRTGVFTFLVPAVVGIFVLVSAWVSQIWIFILYDPSALKSLVSYRLLTAQVTAFAILV